MKFVIGTNVETGAPVECDLDALLRGRGIGQAMSGGGKSWLIRRILEQTFGHVQQFVMDSEGDFKTLREKFDYLLVAAGSDGDIVASIETAAILAEKLLELGVSAILDISGLPTGSDGGQRSEFVKRFLQALLDAPQHLWHDTLFVLDEAQLFAPQRYDAISKKTVNDAAGLVRKRGIGLLLATNKLSEIDKATTGHLENKLIGRSMGIDALNAGRELGLTPKDARQLQVLEDGEFYAFGKAISRQVVRLRVGAIETTHPSPSGRGDIVAPPTPRRVKALLAELRSAMKPPPAPATPAPQAEVGNASREAGRARQASAAPAPAGCDHAPIIERLTQERDVHWRRIQGLDEDLTRMGGELNVALEKSMAAESIAFGLRQLIMLDAGAPIDLDAIVERVVARIGPNGHGAAGMAGMAQIAPPEALRKKHLQAAADRLCASVTAAAATVDARTVIEYLIGQDVGVAISRIANALSGSDGGNVRVRWQKAMTELISAGVIIKVGSGRMQYKADVRGCVERELAPHAPKPDEIASVEQNVLSRLAHDAVADAMAI
jgi:hypothetical protein